MAARQNAMQEKGRKKMKQFLKKAAARISSFVLSAALIVGTLPVYAAGTTISAASAGAKPGESVTIEVRIEGNTGITNFDLAVSFDSDLTLKSVSKNGYLCADGMFVANTSAGYVVWADSKECDAAGGTLFSLTFEVSEQAKSGEHTVSISIKDGGTVSGNGQKLDVEFESGTVTVSGAAQRPTTGSGVSQATGGSASSAGTSDGAVTPDYPNFSDVRKDAWYYRPVSELALSKVVSGYPDGSFRPSGTVTYAEALKLILLASGYSVQQQKSGGHWAAGYYDFACGAGLISLDIGLDDAISRLEIARIIAGAVGMERSAEKSPFSDCDDESVASLYHAGIVKGYDGNSFMPQNTITRAEMSMIIWRLYSYAASGQVNG